MDPGSLYFSYPVLIGLEVDLAVPSSMAVEDLTEGA